MRILLLIVLTLCLGALALAAEPQAALEQRVNTLSDRILALQEDMGKALVKIDTLSVSLKKTQAALDAEVAARTVLAASLADEVNARKALEEKVATLQKQVNDQATALADFQKKALEADTALGKRIDDTNTALTALDKKYADQVTALKDALDKERAERVASDTANAKEIKKSRTLTYVVGGLLGIGIAAKK